jgi:bis(5'-nucleosyl)-tetraphosphatase (symmetrical)
MRACRPDGTIDVKAKGAPQELKEPLLPWYAVPDRRSQKVRVVFGHWSTLGYIDDHGVLGLDTGCVWGGALTAVDLDRPGSRWAIPSEGYRAPGGD